VSGVLEATVAAYLEDADREAAGFVEGLYLVGSAALGEFLPGTSDVDFLAVSARPADAGTVRALARAHRRLRRRRPRPFFDGRYVTWADLGRDPAEAGPGPYAAGGRFRGVGAAGCDPVAWHTLAAHGLRCRGPTREALRVFTDADALRRWVAGNLEGYWRPLLRGARTIRPWRPWSVQAATSYGAVWIVLGICRLHATLATGRILGKDAAGRYGLETFAPRWHRVLQEARRIRRADRARPDPFSAAAELVRDRESLYRHPAARRADVLAFAEMVLHEGVSGYRSPGGVPPGCRRC
jgi:hypothetical protein